MKILSQSQVSTTLRKPISKSQASALLREPNRHPQKLQWTSPQLLGIFDLEDFDTIATLHEGNVEGTQDYQRVHK